MGFPRASICANRLSMAESVRDIDGLGLAELKRLLLQVLQENAQLKNSIAALRDENARLKGLKSLPPA